MAKQAPLSRAELEVAQVLWRLKEATVRQVFEAIPPQRGIDFWTVQTLLRRMETKQYVQSKMEGRTRRYKPRVQEKTVVARLTKDFVDRVFDGEALPLLQHLIRNKELSSDDVEKLRELLNEKSD